MHEVFDFVVPIMFTFNETAEREPLPAQSEMSAGVKICVSVWSAFRPLTD